RRREQHDVLLPARVLRAVHAVPQRHRQGGGVDGAAVVGRRPDAGALRGDDGRVDLRAGPGRPEPDAVGAALLRAGGRRAQPGREGGSRRRRRRRVRAGGTAMNAPVETAVTTIEFELDGERCEAVAGETILQAARRRGVEIPTLCYKDGYRADG